MTQAFSCIRQHLIKGDYFGKQNNSDGPIVWLQFFQIYSVTVIQGILCEVAMTISVIKGMQSFSETTNGGIIKHNHRSK